MNTKKILLALSFFIISICALKAQKPKLEYSGFFDSYYFRGPWAFTLGLGATGYNGDLCKNFSCNTPLPYYSLGVSYKPWPRTVFGVEYSYFGLKSQDMIPERGLTFKSNNHEFDLFGRLYLIEDIVRIAADRSRKPKRFKIYIHAGIGLLNYNPVSYGIVTDSLYIKTEDKSYPSTTLVIPAGLGLSFSFSHRVQLLAELTYKYAFSDYLDDVGAARGEYKGLKDGFAVACIKVQYAPFAPKVKKKKKYKGKNPDSGGGGEGSGDDDSTSPAETPTVPAEEGADPADPEPAEGEPAEGEPAEGEPAEGGTEPAAPEPADPADPEPAEGEPAEEENLDWGN